MFFSVCLFLFFQSGGCLELFLLMVLFAFVWFCGVSFGFVGWRLFFIFFDHVYFGLSSKKELLDHLHPNETVEPSKSSTPGTAVESRNGYTP